MSRRALFWRNVTLIGLAHVAILAGLTCWSHESGIPSSRSIIWMSGAVGETDGEKSVVPKARKAATPSAEVKSSKMEETDDEQSALTPAKSDIQLPTPKPHPTSTITSKPSATAKPTPKPQPKSTPKPKKIILAKVSPKSSSKVRPSPQEIYQKVERSDVDAKKKKMAQATVEKNTSGKVKNDASEKSSGSAVAQVGTGKVASGGGGHASSPEFGWYGSMLHDRFYSEWIQPATNVTSGAKISALVKIRIEKDGRISNFEMIRRSGNAAVDESVAAIAKRVSQVDPLPAGLGNGDHYDVRINFELNSE
jgi:TonB family protein